MSGPPPARGRGSRRWRARDGADCNWLLGVVSDLNRERKLTFGVVDANSEERGVDRRTDACEVSLPLGAVGRRQDCFSGVQVKH